MTDILERALAHQWWYSDANLATNLIHELKKEQEAHDKATALLAEANKEIERLRLELAHATSDVDALGAESSEARADLRAAQAEIERLDKGWQEANSEVLSKNIHIVGLNSEIERLQQENAVLRIHELGDPKLRDFELEAANLKQLEIQLHEQNIKIGQLRAYVAEIEGRPVLKSEWEKQQDEIEKLKDELLEAQSPCESPCRRGWELIDDNKRLRELIQAFIAHLETDWLPSQYDKDDYPESYLLIQRGREALGEKP